DVIPRRSQLKTRSSLQMARAMPELAVGSQRSKPERARSFGGGTLFRSLAIREVKRGRTKITRGKPAAAAFGRPALTIPRLGLRFGARVIPSHNTIRSRVLATTSTRIRP